jgi:16S rRNA (uracil1498-N3)-methyltransferase
VGHAHHRRFLVSPEAVGNGQVAFSPVQARQLVAVLRLREGDVVTVLDGAGREWTACLTLATRGKASARLLEEHVPQPPPRTRFTLAQVVPRGPAMDFIVGKATELGVACIIPLEAARSVRRAPRSGQGRRWRRIIAEATEQCGRSRMPDLAEPCTLDELLHTHPSDQPLLACDNAGDAVPLAEVCRSLASVQALTVLVGGEGGLTVEEVDRVRATGGRLVALGPHLLRAETAALAALVVVQACLGDWAGPNAAEQ